MIEALQLIVDTYGDSVNDYGIIMNNTRPFQMARGILDSYKIKE